MKKKNNEKKDKNNNKINWINDEEIPKNIYSTIDNKLEPIKLVYKYKNNNNKNQYIIYIFVGDIGKRFEHIFKKIEELSLYETLISLTNKEEEELIKYYGNLWMTKFFNIYHISAFVNKLETNATIKKELLKKYDDKWITNFINRFKNNIIFKKINYSYSELIKRDYKITMGKKLEKVLLSKEDIENISFIGRKEYNRNNILYNVSNNMIGGNNDDYESLNMDNILDNSIDDNIDDMDELYNSENEVDDNGDDYEISTIETEQEEYTTDEMEKIYQLDEVDSNISKTGTLISNILNDNKIIEKKNNYMIKFDKSNDENIENEDLSVVYSKKFIYTSYIFKDDSIKTIRNKICCSIKLNSKFSSDLYLIPSRMYLWSEYLMNNKLEKIMLGQKWLIRNELLNLDVEPLTINNYENLEKVIKNLRDTYKRYTGKIKREDEDSNILYDYNDYLMNDTIYMVDIYNELGLNYNPSGEQLQNMIDTYFKIYFPKIKIEDIDDIINLLNKNQNNKIEIRKTTDIFNTIYNDTIIEKEITDLIENTKMDKKEDYLKLFETGNFITQSVIHVYLNIYDEQLEEENKENLKLLSKITGEYGSIYIPKLDLFRIFNDFTPSDDYPFIQYQVPDGKIIFKYNENYMYEFSKSKDNIDLVTKWFENSPYGISFKVKLTENKFMGITINDIGKIEYKTQWKEEDAANIEDVINTYDYVKNLVIKINNILSNSHKKIFIKIPEDYEFKFAFINFIQKFKLPNNKIIDHNDLSDFCVFFYPYISLVIEPKKRISKISSVESKSKYGSYLRYKRVSKFENQGKIEQKILSYIKNYDFSDDLLGEQISKQFNITIEKAKEEISKIRNKFPNISKNKGNLLKKTEHNLPKTKAPGIGIDIQGKIPEKYKIRISGARDQKQLERIVIFMNILLYLYAETYINKNPEYQVIKDKLRKLTNVAKRRNKVDEVVNYQKEINIVKQMAQVDKKRLGFTPEEGQNQYTRSCQNSGNDKKRRPHQTTMNNISELISKGYILNKKTGEYEKKVVLKKKGKNNEIILKPIKVTDQDETTGAMNELLYSCNPDDNGEHMFVGFLTRSNNPFGECMPCCFKKDPLISKKKEKQDFYTRCLEGKKETLDNQKSSNSFMGDILYILQDTNKIQEGRIGYLPKYLDIITNMHFKKEKKIKNHYLLKTDGFFFKYGINQEDYSFLNTLSVVLNMSIDEIKTHIIDFLKLDSDENYYFSLNDGDIRAEYRINDFIDFIKNEQYIDYYYFKDFLKIEGLFTKNGILPIIFNKSTTVIKKGVEKEKIKEDFYLMIDKSMVIDYEYYLNMFKTKDLLILIKDGKYYYPLVEIIKLDETVKNIQIRKLYNNENKDDIKLIDMIKEFYNKTIENVIIDTNKFHTTARETYILLSNISKKNNNYEVVNQVVDSRFKTKYLITKKNYIIPVIPSGIINNIPILCLNINQEKNDCFSKIKFHNIEITNKYLDELYILSNKKINIKPIGVFYDNIDKNDMVNIIGIKTSNNDFVPINNIAISKDNLDKDKILYQNRPLYHELDNKLENYDKNNQTIIDDRIKEVNKDKYLNEAYQLFKFELSNLLNDKNYTEFKQQLKDYIVSKNVNKIQSVIHNLCLNKINNKTLNKNNIVGTELVKIIKELPNLNFYNVNNQRNLCSRLDENTCNINPHCIYTKNNTKSKKDNNSKCSYAITEDYLLEFIKKLSIEIIGQDVKAYELLREKRYHISDIVDYNNFTEKPGQRIIKSSNTNLQKILTDIFGKEHIPKIGKRHVNKKNIIDLQLLQLEYPLKDIKDAYSQTIIPYNYSIIRAYVNGYYWIKHELYNNESRNLGYYSELQNEIINLFRSILIDWLNIPNNILLLINLDEKIKNIIKNNILFINEQSNVNNIVNNYIINFMEKNIENNIGLFELFVFNIIHNIPIVILINNNIKYFINKQNINVINTITSDTKYLNSNNICINLNIINENIYPNIVEIIYYK